MSSLVLFCASHLEETARCRTFDHMLESWKKQIYKVDLYISLSYDLSKKQICQKIVEWQQLPNLTLFLQSSHHSQFEHYQILAEKYALIHDPLVTWITFTDDDDSWGSQRFDAFYQTLSQRHRDTLPMIQIRGSGSTDISYASTNEYYEYCVRLDVLLYFVRHASPEILHHTLADCFFVKYLTPPLINNHYLLWHQITCYPEIAYHYQKSSLDCAHNNPKELQLAERSKPFVAILYNMLVLISTCSHTPTLEEYLKVANQACNCEISPLIVDTLLQKNGLIKKALCNPTIYQYLASTS